MKVVMIEARCMKRTTNKLALEMIVSLIGGFLLGLVFGLFSAKILGITEPNFSHSVGIVLAGWSFGMLMSPVKKGRILLHLDLIFVTGFAMGVWLFIGFLTGLVYVLAYGVGAAMRIVMRAIIIRRATKKFLAQIAKN